jgi:N-acetylglucosaminyldiphosphoundecaprenol N-acetyl-beta-D-mannosaminyltransferase
MLSGIPFDPITEPQAITHIVESIKNGRGGWVATPNIDILRNASKEPALSQLLASAPLVVADGMPLIWATRLRGDPLPGVVTGSSMIFSVTEAAARHNLSIYLLGGGPGVAEQAGEALCRRYPGLTVAGTDSPDVDRNPSASTLDAVRARLVAAAPDIVYVGLGFPKQERIITGVAEALPKAWFLGCGAAIAFAAGSVERAPRWMQRAGLEWVHRLVSEPRRLFTRYVVHDAPFAAVLLTSSALGRARRKRQA